jgi:hypothetical protein
MKAVIWDMDYEEDLKDADLIFRHFKEISYERLNGLMKRI